MQKKKILITGSSGYFGKILINYFCEIYEIFEVDKHIFNSKKNSFKCDLTKIDQVSELEQKISPDVIIHAAGIKDISFCEKFPEIATAINYNATKNIIDAFGATSKIIYISTDYVFDGEKGNYREGDITIPTTIYGKTKLMGENAIKSSMNINAYIVRTSAIYDENASFLKYLENELKESNFITAYSDVMYSPTWVVDFNIALHKLIENDYDLKILHICGKSITRFDFAKLYAKVFGYSEKLIIKGLKDQGVFLLKNLTLDAQQTNAVLSHTQTPHSIALKNFLKKK